TNGGGCALPAFAIRHTGATITTARGAVGRRGDVSVAPEAKATAASAAAAIEASRRAVMRFQITGQGWPVGQHLIPSGTLIDFSERNMWTALAQGRGIPLTATALDDEAWQAQLQAYPRHLLGNGPPPPASTQTETETAEPEANKQTRRTG